MNEELLKRRVIGLIVKNKFKPILENFDADLLMSKAENDLALARILANKTMDPEIIVRVSILEEEVELYKNLRSLIQDIINLDWDREETEHQFESMKVCFNSMNERIHRLGKEVALLGESF